MIRPLKILPFTVILVMAAILFSGCNVFDILSDAEKSPTEKAEESIREGNYTQAKEELAEAVKDSSDAIALYLDAKATILEAGIDMFEIVELIEGQEDEESLEILQTIEELCDTDEKMTDWYQANMKAAANLSKIFDNDLSVTLDSEAVALDYTVTTLVSGVLGIRDTNRDGVINNDDFQINLSLIEDIAATDGEGFNFDGGEFEDEFGNMQEFSGLEVFLGVLPPAAGKVTAGGTIKGAKGYTPEDINELLAFVLTILDNGKGGLRSLLGKYNSSFDAHEIEDYLYEIASIINYYWYNDGVDNDGDGLIDEEMIDGVDNDGDGFIDEDSDYTDPAIVLAEDYDPADYFPEALEINDLTNESKIFVEIWNKWKNR